jgi:hypothetical protein
MVGDDAELPVRVASRLDVLEPVAEIGHERNGVFLSLATRKPE